MNTLPAIALAREIRENPYANFMSISLAERCAELQNREASGHWASMREELTLARATLADCVQFYSAMTMLPQDQKGRIEAIMEAGRVLRAAIGEVTSLAQQAAKIEIDLKDRHDPQITMQFIQQTVRLIDEKLRLAEEEGELKDAEKIIDAISRGVNEEVRLPLHSPLGLNENNKPVGISPASTLEVVKSMINTVPAA